MFTLCLPVCIFVEYTQKKSTCESKCSFHSFRSALVLLSLRSPRKRPLRPLCHLPHSFDVHLALAAVIGVQAVDFPLHVAELGVDVPAQTVRNGGENHFTVHLFDVVGEGFFGGGGAVAVLLFVGKVILHRAGESAAFAQKHRAATRLQHRVAEIDVLALQVAVVADEPAGGGVPEAGGVEGLQDGVALV